MPRARNELGQFVKNEGGHFNYIPIPSLYTMFLISLAFTILYPWLVMLWGFKQKMSSLFSFLMNMIPNDTALDTSCTTKSTTGNTPPKE